MSDRFWLLLRLLLMFVPLGAWAGLAVWAGQEAAERLMARVFGPRGGAMWPLPIALLTAPAGRQLAVALCSGGSMSRLSFHDPLEWALSVILPVLAAGSAWLAQRALRAMRAHPRRWLVWTALWLSLSFALGKINQWVLPNLYDYLHALLALGAFACAALGAFVALSCAPSPRVPRLSPRAAFGALVVASGCWVGHVMTLGHNLNVRVALFDARAASSRALLTYAEPALRRVDQFGTRHQGGPVRSRVTYDTSGLAQHRDAHVVLITIDALRADHLGSYGYTRPTSPKLDERVRHGVRFERAYAQAPHSSYSLTSLMTSEYVHEVVDLERELPEATLATVLRAAGYHTAAFFTDGIFHTEGERLAQYRDGAFGFALFDHTHRDATQTTDRVAAEVDRIVGQGEPPSLLWVHYFDVHEPYREQHFGRSDVDRYDSEIRRVDREVDRLLSLVEERLERDVIVAITADHGEEFRDHGGVYHGSTLYDEQVRVPLLMFAPSFDAAQVATPVELVDVAPTLLGLVGVEPAPSMRGRDLRPLAAGRRTEGAPVFSAVTHKRMVVRWPYKLVADLRFNLFELYDLSRDPDERRNLANARPQLLADLKDEAYAWLDSLERAPDDAPPQTPSSEHDWEQALHWGRLGDRRAVPPMCQLLLDSRAPTALRTQAGRILAKLSDPKSTKALVRGLSTEPPEVAAEAAIALGRMYDTRARRALRRLVHAEDPELRARAAISLGRLRDRAAVPALIDALWVAPSQYEREEAVRWLGRLRDPRGVEPLLSLLPEFRLRYLVVVALGQIGDERSFEALLDTLSWEHHTNIRDNVVRGLGQLGDARAIAPLVDVAETETGLKNLSESLVRLGAIARGAIGGADLHKGTPGRRGFGRCDEGPLMHDWNYLGRTHCETQRSRASLLLKVPAHVASAAHGASLRVRMRRNNDSSRAAKVELTIDGRPVGRASVDGKWVERRFELPPGILKAPRVRLAFVVQTPDATLSVDHALLVPRRDVLAAAEGD